MASVNSRPLVGVTGPAEGGWMAWTATRLAIWRAGGRARRLHADLSAETELSALEELSALIIGGGADIDPGLYNEEPWPSQINRERKRSVGSSIFHFTLFVGLWLLRRLFSSPYSKREDKLRDELESRLIRHAIERGLPMLGICRGMQLINVHFGGSLFQDIASFYVEAPQLRTVLPRKKIAIEPGSQLSAIIGRRLTRVNSLHHQSVKRLGEALRISALESTGVIQAIEHLSLPFVMGVQWHPEFLPQDRHQQNLFRRLVTVARQPLLSDVLQVSTER